MKTVLKTTVAALSVMAFHDVLAGRIDRLDINDPASVALADRIAEDTTTTKVPANKITPIYAKLQDKMAEVTSSDSPYVDQVNQFLMRADQGLKGQINYYVENGDLSDTTTVVDKTDELDLAGAAAADRSLNGTGKSDVQHHQV